MLYSIFSSIRENSYIFWRYFMTQTYEQIVADLQQNKASYDVNQLISYLATTDLSIVQTIRVVREIAGVDMGEAKEYVSQHPAFIEVHRQSKNLHKEALKAVESAD
jgi:ribosomal protein L7/L12